MRSTSADYKSAIYATDRECRGYIKFNNDGTKIIRGVDGLISITLHEQLCDEERPMINCACSRYVEVEFFNSGLPGGVSLANSYIDTYMGVVTKDTGTAPIGSIEPDTKTVEYIWNGRFFISEIDRGNLSTKVVAYDEFAKLNKQYAPTVTKGVSGYSANDILIDVLTQCAFTQAVGGISGYVQEIPECTCRQMMGWLIGAYSLGSNALMSRSNPNNFGPRTLSTQWTHRDDADHAVTDNEIYLGGLADGDTFTVSSVTTGTADNPIVAGSGTGLVGENPYLTQANATTIYNNVNGITFKPMTIEFRGNPAIDTGDVLKVTSGGSSNYCYVQRLTTTFNGGIKQKIECFGDSVFYYSTELSPTNAQIKNAVSSMAQEIQQEIETADNGVITKVLDLDGSWKELVIANSQDLSAATSVWRWNINGLAHSTAYSGGTYNFAVDMNGRIIADVIQTGILQDAAGKNSWNLDTGALSITDGNVLITTSGSTYSHISLANSTVNCDGDYTATKLVFFDGQTPSARKEATYNASGIQLTLEYDDKIGIRYDSYITCYDNGLLSAKSNLSPTALTFYNSSGTVTATYPATGLPMLNGAADNTTQSGAVIAVPYVTHSTLGISSSATDFEVSKAWAKYVAAQYPNKEYCVFIGTVSAGSVRNAQMMAYKTNNTNADGIPQYCNVQLSRYTGGIYYYTCDNGTYKRVAFLDQSSLRFLDSNGYSTATYPATSSQLSPTYTTNSYCSSTSVGRVWIRRQGSFGVMHFNLSIDSTSLTSSAGEVEIMRFSGITLQQAGFFNIPSQSGSSTILMSISTAGIVKIYTAYGSANGFYRAEVPLMFAS